MVDTPLTPDAALARLRRPLFLTRAGLVAERLVRTFWPLFSILIAMAAALMLGLHEMLPIEAVWIGGVTGTLAALAALVMGARAFAWPTTAEAMARLDESLPGRPIQALVDAQAIGMDDPASAAVWRAHQARMADRAAAARAVQPDLSLNRRDPYALRYAALLVFAVALIFGSALRIGSVQDMAPGAGSPLAGGPAWEGWVEPPRYTGLPTIYLNDVRGGALNVPEGSRVTLRLYGEVGALTLAETVSGRTGEVPPASDPAHDFTVAQAGELRIDGPGGRVWAVSMIEDLPPAVAVTGPPEAEAFGQMALPFTASDDYGVIAGKATIALDVDAVDRRHGLAVGPEPRAAIELPLPMPIAGDRVDFEETLIEDFSEHPFANLPVTFTLRVEDAEGQVTASEPFAARLPGRRFFDPLAAAIVEQRRDLLWQRENAARIAQVLRAVSHRPDDLFRSETAYLRLRVILRRIEAMAPYGLSDDQVDETAEALWDLALLLEEGDVADALERLRRAQERLSEAMRNGASDQEIAELMQELREATDDYIRQLSRQAQQQGEMAPQDFAEGQQNQMQMTQDDLQRMMDRIQELMEQGRMAEAQQALEELQRLMENMRVTQGQGQNGQSPGQQAMEGLAETLREQQGLSDQAFRDLQEQFNPNAQQGESQQNQGRDGGMGQGQQHSDQGQQGQGQGQQPGQGDNQSAQGGGGGQPGDLEGTLADRQRALRDELRRQQNGLPGAGTPEGQAARDALDRAGRAMDGAEDALRQDDYAGAIDRQSEAMDALRDGMRALGEQLAEQQQGQQGQAAQQGDQQAQGRDPLGRDQGSNGSLGTNDNLLQGDDVYRRARDLLDEIRRRSGEANRPEFELDYLRRLLERF
jgi:uncharacterized protein (TIGR02302 family)